MPYRGVVPGQLDVDDGLELVIRDERRRRLRPSARGGGGARRAQPVAAVEALFVGLQSLYYAPGPLSGLTIHPSPL
jgi:hypothetical protein